MVATYYLFVLFFLCRRGCEKEGEVCCEKLKMAEPFVSRPDRSSTQNELESGSNEGHLDLDAEDIVDSGEDDYFNLDAREELKATETTTGCTTTSTEATPTSPVYDFDSDDFEGTAGPHTGYKCGVATPHLILEEKLFNGDGCK